MGQPITTVEQGWLEQQEAIRIGTLKGLLRDLDLLNYHPEYRSEYFNETNINQEISSQNEGLEQIRSEIRRRQIP